MLKVLQSDPVNGRGERRAPRDVLSILEGFNFNRDTSLQNVLKAPYSTIINQAAMQATISFPSFIPQDMIDTASGANPNRPIYWICPCSYTKTRSYKCRLLSRRGNWFINKNLHQWQKTTLTRSVSADRIKNGSAFERTREDNAEFKRASKAAKLLRTIFKEVTIIAKDKITHARLMKVLISIIKGDPINERGARTVNNGDVKALMNFHFNERAGITNSLFVRCPINFNRVSGEVVVYIPVLCSITWWRRLQA